MLRCHLQAVTQHATKVRRRTRTASVSMWSVSEGAEPSDLVVATFSFVPFAKDYCQRKRIAMVPFK